MNKLIQVVILATTGLVSLPVSASLSINLDFTDFNTQTNLTYLTNDSWNGSTSDATKLAAARSVIRTAANYWESAFAPSSGSITHNVTVDWSNLGGNTLAQAGSFYFASGPNEDDFFLDGSGHRSGTMTWDGDGSSTFFVDLTPNLNEEWNLSSERSDNLGVSSINVERIYYQSNTTASANSDLLSVAIHELGHVMGYTDAYIGFNNDLSAGSFTFQDGNVLPMTSAHSDYSALTDPPGLSPSSTYYPNVMGPSLISGTRNLLSEADVAVVAAAQDLDAFNATPVPEPSTLLFSFVGLGALALRRKRAA